MSTKTKNPKKPTIIAVLLAASLALTAVMVWAANDTWVPIGPNLPGGKALDMVADPAQPGTFLAAVRTHENQWARVYRGVRNDDALQWTAVYTTPASLRSLAMAGDRAYVNGTAFDPGLPFVSRSDDGGLTWRPVLTSTGFSELLSLAVNPAEPDQVYAGGQANMEGFVFASADGGDTWTQSWITYARSIWALAVAPTSPPTIIAGGRTITGGSIIYRSTDLGLTWTPRLIIIGGCCPIEALLVHPITPTIAFAHRGEEVYRSTDGGDTWTSVHTTTAAGSEADASLALDPQNPDIVYAKAWDVLHRSTDGGDTWAWQADLPEDSRAFLVDPADGDRFYVTTWRGIYRSDDAGATWVPDQAGITSPLPGPEAFAVGSDERLYLGAQEWGGDSKGLYVSLDDGLTWTRPISDIEVNSVAVAPLNPTLVYAVGSPPLGAEPPFLSKIYRSTDGGDTWEAVWSQESGGNLKTVAVAPDQTSTVYVVGGNLAETFLYTSADGGDTWTETQVPGLGYARPLVVDPISPTTLYLGGWRTDWTQYGQVLRSTDGGASWETIFTGERFGRQVTGLAVNPQRPEIIYVAVNGEVHKSTDGGESWTRLDGAPDVKQLILDPAVPSVIYSEDWSGLYRSADAGETWDPITDNLPADANFMTLGLRASADSRTLYAGLYDMGAWKRVEPAPEPGPPVNIQVTVEPQTLPADGRSQATVRALVTDEYGNWVADGTPVSFFVTRPMAAVEQAALATVPTVDGVAEITYTADTEPGQVRIFATTDAVVGWGDLTLYIYRIYLPMVMKAYVPAIPPIWTSTTWAATQLSHQVGQQHGDSEWYATAEQGPGFLAYGPYVTLPAGTYRVTFRLMVDNNTADANPVALVDVYRDAGGLGGTFTINRRQFNAAYQYQDFAILFNLDKVYDSVEFRVWVTGVSYVRMASVTVETATSLKPTLNDAAWHGTLWQAYGPDILHGTGQRIGDSTDWETFVSSAKDYMLYGPYVDLPDGWYRVTYRLKVDVVEASDDVIADPNVSADYGNRIIIPNEQLRGLRADRENDGEDARFGYLTRRFFEQADTWQDLSGDFDAWPNNHIELRIRYLGHSYLAVDHVRLQRTIESPMYILFAHGFQGTASDWDTFARHARRNDWIVFRYSVSKDAGIGTRAGELASQFRGAREDGGKELPWGSVKAVGHSMGGLDLRYAVSEAHQRDYRSDSDFTHMARRLRKIYTLATPHGGSGCAAIGTGGAYKDLTVDEMKEFNRARPNSHLNLNLPYLGQRRLTLLAWTFSPDARGEKNCNKGRYGGCAACSTLPTFETPNDGVVEFEHQKWIHPDAKTLETPWTGPFLNCHCPGLNWQFELDATWVLDAILNDPWY